MRDSSYRFKANFMEKWDRLENDIFEPIRIENNHTELYVDGPQCMELLLREIKKARHFINVQVMLFYSDSCGFKVAEALAAKAKEGVRVRVMSDSAMSNIVRGIEKFRSEGTSSFEDLKKLFTKAGVKFLASNKESYWLADWDEKRKELRQKGVPEKFLEMQDVIQQGTSLDLNVFDHRKAYIFDGETAIITGANIGNKYLYEEQPGPEEDDGGLRWHDGAVLIKGPCATVANMHFASKWMVRGGDIFDYYENYRKKEKYGSDACTIYSFSPGMKEHDIRNFYFEKIRNCKAKLYIENPYINDEEFWKELCELPEEQARKIILINPYKAKGNDYPQNEAAIKCRMWTPFKKGVRFYSYRKRMSHWKILYDEAASQVFLGSFNLNHRSSHHDFEMNVLIESERLAGDVKQMLERDISESTEITDENEFYENPQLHPSCLLLDATEYFE